MFRCYDCGKNRWERDRVFQATNLCDGCYEKQDRAVRVNSESMLCSRPPQWVLDQMKVDRLRRKGVAK